MVFLGGGVVTWQLWGVVGRAGRRHHHAQLIPTAPFEKDMQRSTRKNLNTKKQ